MDLNVSPRTVCEVVHVALRRCGNRRTPASGRLSPAVARRALVPLLAIAGTVLSPATAVADPTDLAPGIDAATASPYPDLRYFTEIDAAPYNMSALSGVSLPDQAGYWFTTAQGLDCGIWFRGSFGCRGAIPGAAPDVRQIGWITGDTRVHHDWTLAIRFPQGIRSGVTIPPLSFIDVEGTKCATTVDHSTYCERGPARLLIATTHTWSS